MGGTPPGGSSKEAWSGDVPSGFVGETAAVIHSTPLLCQATYPPQRLAGECSFLLVIADWSRTQLQKKLHAPSACCQVASMCGKKMTACPNLHECLTWFRARVVPCRTHGAPLPPLSLATQASIRPCTPPPLAASPPPGCCDLLFGIALTAPLLWVSHDSFWVPHPLGRSDPWSSAICYFNPGWPRLALFSPPVFNRSHSSADSDFLCRPDKLACADGWPSWDGLRKGGIHLCQKQRNAFTIQCTSRTSFADFLCAQRT